MDLEEDYPKIIKRTGPVCYYVMNLAEFGELYRLVELNNRLSEATIRHLFSQLMHAICYLHRNGIVHRDIKPENVLVDRKCRVILADFNFAIQLQPQHTSA